MAPGLIFESVPALPANIRLGLKSLAREKRSSLLAGRIADDGKKFDDADGQIDTGRNYFSLDSLKRMVDAMSYNKMNVLVPMI